jgi:hypothetical protein
MRQTSSLPSATCGTLSALSATHHTPTQTATQTVHNIKAFWTIKLAISYTALGEDQFLSWSIWPHEFQLTDHNINLLSFPSDPRPPMAHMLHYSDSTRWAMPTFPNMFNSSIHSFIHLWLYSPLLGPGLFFTFTIFFTQTVGLLGWVISPSQGRYLHRTTQTQNKRTQQTPIPWVGFEPTIREFERVWANKDSLILAQFREI